MRFVRHALLLIAIAWLPASSVWATDRVHRDAASVQPLPVGAAVPAAPLRTPDDEPTDLARVLAGSGALLVFYRGGW
jgi:hypothetical protein